jgi:hypothetical protein
MKLSAARGTASSESIIEQWIGEDVEGRFGDKFNLSKPSGNFTYHQV